MKPIVALSTVAGSTLALTLAGFSLADDDHHERKGYKRPKRLSIPSDAPLVWKEECAARHTLYSPGLLPADAWREQMRTLSDHYGSNASLDPAQEKEILDFLVRASAANRLPVEPSPTTGEPPRISQTRWFGAKYDEVSGCSLANRSVAASTAWPATAMPSVETSTMTG